MDEPVVYRIRIREQLGPEWAARLAGLRMTTCGAASQSRFTDLTGPLPDQAALMGVLEQLYAMGATLVSIERLSK